MRNKNRACTSVYSLLFETHRTAVVLLLAIALSFVAGFVLSALFPGSFSLLNGQIADRLFRIRYMLGGKEEIAPQLVHVFLTDSDVEELHVTLWDRNIFGRVIDVLERAGIEAAACDIFFHDESTSENDMLLLDAARRGKNIYFPLIIDKLQINRSTSGEETDNRISSQLWHPVVTEKGKPFEAKNILAIFNALARVSKGMGHITCEPDADGFNRRYPLVYKYKDGYIPALGLRMVCEYFDVEPRNIVISFGSEIRLKNARVAMNLRKDVVIPIDSNGRMIVNYIGPWTDSFVNLSFKEVLAAEKNEGIAQRLKETIGDALVLISDVSTRNKDYGPAVFDSVYPLSGIHLSVVNAILNENFLKTQSMPVSIVSALLFAFCLWIASRRFGPIGFTIASVIALILFLASSIIAFIWAKQLMNVAELAVGALLAVIAVVFFKLLLSEKEKGALTVRTKAWIDSENDKMRLLSQLFEGFTPPVNELLVPLRSMSEASYYGLPDNFRKQIVEMRGKAEQLAAYVDTLSERTEQSISETYAEENRDTTTRARLYNPAVFEGIVTGSSKMFALFSDIEALAKSTSPVLIQGERGTGKELIAEAIHAASVRKGDFVPVNTAGLDDTMFSDALFGHKKGAYTGAEADRIGLIGSAHEGTLFLDEIGDLSLASQVKLLRLLEKGEYRPLGDAKILYSQARIIAATNADLSARRETGLFREDLYDRLALRLVIPPLRERIGDLAMLVDHFSLFYAKKLAKPLFHLSEDALTQMRHYRFPGNIRELSGILEMAFGRSESDEALSGHISEYIREHQNDAKNAIGFSGAGRNIISLDPFPTLDEIEEHLIKAALKACEGNQVSASKLLGLTPSTLCRRLKKYKEWKP